MRRLQLVAAVIATTVVVSAAWLFFRQPSPDFVLDLLAQAYSEQRTLELRIPGAQYKPFRLERGGKSDASKLSESFLEAALDISKHELRYPHDPKWLHATARRDLLEHDYSSAIRSLQHARENQGDSPGLLTDLASAYFEQAQESRRQIDFGNAIEILGEALQNLR